VLASQPRWSVYTVGDGWRRHDALASPGRLNVTTNAATARTTDGDDDNLRLSNSEDEQLVHLWQFTIASRKVASQDTDVDRTADPTLPTAYVEWYRADGFGSRLCGGSS
jgi:hypothetical protein